MSIFDKLKEYVTRDSTLQQISANAVQAERDKILPWGAGRMNTCGGGGSPIKMTDRAMQAILTGRAPFLGDTVEMPEGNGVMCEWKYDAIRFSHSEGKIFFMYAGEDVGFIDIPGDAWYSDVTLGCLEGKTSLSIT
jgi:hypothetical protein